jgi:hypothetical protein
MRFPEEGSQDFELVVRAGGRRYDVYMLKVQLYPDLAQLLHVGVDLSRYSAGELDEWVACWGYESYPAFVKYLEEKTPVKNNELRLCSCIVQNDLFLEPDTVADGDVDACIGFMTARLGGRSPYDDSEEEEANLSAEDCRC